MVIIIVIKVIIIIIIIIIIITETDNETQSASKGNMYNEADVGASQRSMSRDTEGLTDEENEIYNRITRVVNGEERDRLPAQIGRAHV